MKILMMHAYSAENAGDGLLVTETLELIQEAFGTELEVTVLASRPESFAHLPVRVVRSIPTRRGFSPDFRAELKSIENYDIIVGVGGGYLRAGTLLELAKTALAHVPQLLAAGRSTVPSIYLPQSVGPARFGTAPLLKRMIGRVGTIMLRDDRSIAQFGSGNALRVADLATHHVLGGRQSGEIPHPRPVVSIRAVHGKTSDGVYTLAAALGEYDGYVQSTVGANDDRAVSATLQPVRVLERSELMTRGNQPRVVVAMRLHAALMALAAGHYVVHLAYERKGFGAYDDLELQPWVHNVNSFDVPEVERQVKALIQSPQVRADYDNRIVESGARLQGMRNDIVAALQAARPAPRSDTSAAL